MGVVTATATAAATALVPAFAWGVGVASRLAWGVASGRAVMVGLATGTVSVFVPGLACVTLSGRAGGRTTCSVSAFVLALAWGVATGLGAYGTALGLGVFERLSRVLLLVVPRSGAGSHISWCMASGWLVLPLGTAISSREAGGSAGRQPPLSARSSAIARMMSWYGHPPSGATSKLSNHMAPLESTIPDGTPWLTAICAAVCQHLEAAAEWAAELGVRCGSGSARAAAA
jgi:hypothetical protein